MGFRVYLGLAQVGRRVGGAAVARPLALELVLEDLGAALARQPGLVQAQLAHLHVVHACDITTKCHSLRSRLKPNTNVTSYFIDFWVI